MSRLFHWVARWPLWLAHAMGAALGWLTYLSSPVYRSRFRANVAQAGVGQAAARAAVAEAGRMAAELPRLWLRGVGSVPFAIHGDTHVRQALAEGRGLVFLTPHLGCFEVCAQAYAHQHGGEVPITVMFRPARKAWLRGLMTTARDRPGLRAVPADLTGVRQMMRALKRGQAVGLLPDQVPPDGMGVWAPFFGKPAYTMTLAARLAQQSGAALLLCWGERRPRGAGYDIHFLPLSDALPSDPDAQAESAAAVNRAMERLILQRPAQYLWGYHRYKSPRAAAPPADPPATH